MQANTKLTTQEKARLMRNKRQREWAKKNPDRIRRYQENYYAKKYDEMIDKMIEDFQEDHERGDTE